MKNFKIFIITLTVAFGVLSVMPTVVDAQAGRTTTAVCQDDVTGQIYRVPSSGDCPVEYTLRSVAGNFSQLCVVTSPSFNVIAPTPLGDTSGTLTCSQGTLTVIRPAPTSPTPPPTPNPNPNPNPTPTPTPTPNPTPTPTPTPTPQPSGGSCIQKGPLCIPANPFANSGGIAGSGSIGQLAVSIISILLYLAGIIAVIFIIIGGYYYMTAAGNDARALSGRKTLVNALIGLAIVILSFLIVQIVTNFLIQGSGT